MDSIVSKKRKLITCFLKKSFLKNFVYNQEKRRAIIEMYQKKSI